MTERGNFEGRNILHVPRPPEAVAEEFGLSPEELWERIVEIRGKLFAAREERVRPGRDEKILAAWNGLMLRSFALAARVTGREDYREAAVKNATFIVEKMKEDGRIHRSYKDGRARFNGYLEDYAMVADGLVALYEATFETRWLVEADALIDAVSELFWDGGEACLLRHPGRPRGARHPPARRLRQRRALGNLRRHRGPAQARPPPRQGRLPPARGGRPRRSSPAAWRRSQAPSGASSAPSTSPPRSPARSP